VGILSDNVSERFDSLDKQTQKIIVALLEQRKSVDEEVSKEILGQTMAIAQILTRLEFNNLNEHQKTRDELRKMDGIERVTNLVNASPEEENKVRVAVEETILRSLAFETMTTRYEQVVPAHRMTFDWIFRPFPTEGPKWDDFPAWLAGGKNGVYWIKGKAGSGKSTLMRYISDDLKTKKHLQAWAKDIALCTGSFYFWNSGTPEQKSQHGLLRALLFEVLSQQPKLIPTVLPWLWAKTYSTLLAELPASTEFLWPLSRLKEAFLLLVRQSAVPVKLCLFIDGLDEFEGDPVEISELFKEISESTSVKVCLSSRPWIEFEECFRDFPSLKLQDLTHKDIECYVTDKLNKNDKFRARAAEQPKQASSLTSEITEKADGVFLWVRIVVDSLLKGLRNRDDISVLQERLELLPGRLKALYAFMFGLIEDIYRQKAAEIFQVVRASRIYRDHLNSQRRQNEPLSILALYFAVASEIDIETIKLYQAPDLAARCEEMEVHLTVRCAGLLEVWKDKEKKINRVQYLHRTARDFIESDQVWKAIQQRTALTKFNPNASMVRSCLYQLLAGRDALTRSRYDLVVEAMIFAYHANREKDKSYIALLDQIDQAGSQLLELKPEKGYWNEVVAGPSPSEHDSFLTFAIQCDLSSYVEEKVKTRGDITSPKKEKSLLEYVVYRQSVTHTLPFSSGVANVLLEHRANPNQKYDEYSVWQKVLYALDKHWVSRHMPARDDGTGRTAEEARDAVALLDAFVKHGANPKAYIVVGNYEKLSRSALGVILRTVKKDFPSEATGLIQRLRGLGAKDQVRSIQTLEAIFRKEMRLFWLDP
jgi:hypothetical protein